MIRYIWRSILCFSTSPCQSPCAKVRSNFDHEAVGSEYSINLSLAARHTKETVDLYLRPDSSELPGFSPPFHLRRHSSPFDEAAGSAHLSMQLRGGKGAPRLSRTRPRCLPFLCLFNTYKFEPFLPDFRITNDLAERSHPLNPSLPMSVFTCLLNPLGSRPPRSMVVLVDTDECFVAQWRSRARSIGCSAYS